VVFPGRLAWKNSPWSIEVCHHAWMDIRRSTDGAVLEKDQAVLVWIFDEAEA
jgi:hypothetical protein